MKREMNLCRAGAVSILGSTLIFWEEPLYSFWTQQPGSLANLSLLYGYPLLAALILLFAKPTHFQKADGKLLTFSHAASLIGVLWLILWCFVWLAIASGMGEKAEMFIKHMAYCHLFGVGFALAGYFTGWMTPRTGERSARFLMGVGWTVSYMAFFNLYLQPTLRGMWASAIGGLLLAFGAYLISRQLKPKVEAAS